MHKRKIFGLLILFGLFCKVMNSVTFGNADKEEAQVPTFSVGNQWAYRLDYGSDLTSEIHRKVLKIDDVQDYWGNNHSCYHISISHEPGIGSKLKSVSIEQSDDNWLRVSDLFMVKRTSETNWMREGGDSTYSYFESYGRSLVNDTRYPIYLGKQFNESIQWCLITTKGINGVINEPEASNIGTSGGEYTVADKMENITTAAGTYECYKLTKFTDSIHTNRTYIEYYSDDLGIMIKSESWQIEEDSTVGMNMTQELIDVNFGALPSYSHLGVFCGFGVLNLLGIVRITKLRNGP